MVRTKHHTLPSVDSLGQISDVYLILSIFFFTVIGKDVSEMLNRWSCWFLGTAGRVEKQGACEA